MLAMLTVQTFKLLPAGVKRSNEWDSKSSQKKTASMRVIWHINVYGPSNPPEPAATEHYLVPFASVCDSTFAGESMHTAAEQQ